MTDVSTLTHYNVPSLKQQNNASKILSETVIPVENCEDKENVLEETKESTHAEDNVVQSCELSTSNFLFPE
jgi:hypothetical protein